MESSLPLRDIHLPEAVGWWPPAIGWWLLPLFILALAALLVWLIHRVRRMTPAKLALRELDLLQQDAKLSPDEKLRRLSILLRRVCLSVYSREDVAGLTGEDWLRWLDRPLKAPGFSQGPGRILLDGAYRRAPAADMEALLRLCRDWVKALSKTKAPRHAPPIVQETSRP
jgi:hypothetical protein